MDKPQGVKYPKALAESETNSRQKFIEKQFPLFADDDEATALLGKIRELNKALFSFTASEGLLFDGLCKLCMDAYDSEHENLLLKVKAGTFDYVKVIERQDMPTETHYRTVLTLEEAQAVFCGVRYRSYWGYVFEDVLKEMAYNPPKKRHLVLGKNLYIDKAPLMVNLIRSDGSHIKKLKTLGPRQTQKQIAEGTDRLLHPNPGKIVGVEIEFFKPLFASILEAASKKKQGKAYIVTPPYFQLSIADFFSDLKTGIEKGKQKSQEKTKELTLKWLKDTFPNKQFSQKELNAFICKVNKESDELASERLQNVFALTPLDIRRFYLYLALHDNHRGDHIDIENLIDFVESCFPRLIEISSTGEKKLYPSRYKELIERYINPILYVYKSITAKGCMDGGQLVPTELIWTDPKTGETFGRENNNLRIKCIKSSTLFSTFTLEEAKSELLNLSNSINNPI